MREVERTRFVDATPAELSRALSPITVFKAEGTFSVVETAETHGETRVTARGGGIVAEFAFEAMETTLTYAASDHGSEVTARSSVSLGLPLAVVTDRVAAWKRRGELKRLLSGLATHV